MVNPNNLVTEISVASSRRTILLWRRMALIMQMSYLSPTLKLLPSSWILNWRPFPSASSTSPFFFSSASAAVVASSLAAVVASSAAVTVADASFSFSDFSSSFVSFSSAEFSEEEATMRAFLYFSFFFCSSAAFFFYSSSCFEVP